MRLAVTISLLFSIFSTCAVHLCLGAPTFVGLHAGGNFNRQTVLSENNHPNDAYSTGSLVGSVVSKSGARLPGVTIILEQDGSGQEYQVVSGEMGVFRASGLREGSYQITVELSGFKPVSIRDVRVVSGIPQVVDIQLEQAFSIEEQVTVIGSSPANSLEAAEIRESLSQDLGEAMSDRAGVWKVRKGGIANDIVLRGFQGRDLNVLIDGHRVYGACPNNMDPSAFHVDFAEVDRVDISKGPFDIKNEGGLGGSINVVTRRPRSGFWGRANFAFGSFGFLNPSADLSYGGDRVSLLGGYSFRRSGPYRDGSGKKTTELTNYSSSYNDHSSYEVGTAWGKIGLELTENQSLELSYTRQDADDIFYPYLKMDAVYDDTNRIGFRYEIDRLSETLKRLSILGYYTDVSHWMTDQFRTSSAMGAREYSMGTMADTRAFGTKIETGIKNWTFGFEAYSRFWGAYTEMAGMNYKPQFSLPDVDMISFGAYAEFRRPVTEDLSVTAGIRADRIESKADPGKANSSLYLAYHGTDQLSKVDAFPSGTVRLDYSALNNLKFSFGFGSAVQVPEPSERYFALKRMGSDWVGNPGLKRSRNNGIDGTVALQYRGIFLDAGIFHNWVSDFVVLYDQERISMFPGVMNNQARSYMNTNARLYGGEFNVGIPLENRVFVSADLSYVRGTKDIHPEKGISSENLAEIPPLRSRLGLRYDDGRFFGVVEGILSAKQDFVDLDLGEEDTPSWGIFNLQVGIRHDIISATVGIGNVFNQYYFEHLSYQRDPFRSGVRVPEPGRHLFVNLAVDF